jgi:uncharacterized membrane protein
MIYKKEKEGVAKIESIRKPASAITTAQRILTMDAHWAFIMVLMAIDHASYFIARVHSEEFWGAGLPVYPNAFWFWTRWITHLCAPGFFFLMGIGMIIFADVRHKAGWDEGRITRFFVIRGLLLMLLQLFVEDPAWLLGDLSVGPGGMLIRGGGVPGGGSPGKIYFGVLFALGGAMVFWAFLRRSLPWVIGLISLGAVLVTQVVTPGVGHISTPYSPLVRLLAVPGHSDVCEVFYPVLPWLGVTGLGLLFGILLQRKAYRAEKLAGWTGLGCLVLFVIIRTTVEFGNLNEVPAGWMGFLNVVRYPPSLGFLTITMGINLIWMAMWGRVEAYFQNRYHPLVVFGQVALFFYLLHLWAYDLLGLLFRSGSGLVMMYVIWLLGLVILYPICYWYNRFKNRNPRTCLWRFL